MNNFQIKMKLKIFSLIPTSILEFLARRIHQDSLLFASIASLATKLSYFFLMDVQFKGIILIFIFFLFYFVNYMGDIYHLHIREPFYKFLVYGMGERALFSVGRFIDMTWIKNPDEAFVNILFRNFLFSLVRIRLFIAAEPYIFIIIHTFLIYFLLFNQFLLTAYLIAFLLIISRMVFHVTDFTGKDVQRSLHVINNYNNRQLYFFEDPSPLIVLKPSIKNSQMLTFWIFRCEGIWKSYMI